MANTHPENLPKVGKIIDSLSYGDLRVEARKWRDQSKSWKSNFERAKERECKKDAKIKELEAEIRLWKQKLFSKKTESKQTTNNKTTLSSDLNGDANISVLKKKKRGHQTGTSGHGRRTYDKLDSVDELHDLPDNKKGCSICGLSYEHKGLTRTTEIVEVFIKAHVRKLQFPQYHKACHCPKTPNIISAPSPPRLIPGNAFGVSIWTELLLSKFCFQNPLSRTLANLDAHKLELPVGTITDGFRRIQPLFDPIIESIRDSSLQDSHWHADETRWSVFVSIEGKSGHRWYLWVYRSETCIYYQLEPSRATSVPESFFPKDIEGILSVDRYSAYKCLIKSRKGLTLAFCWAHVRRDFIDAYKKWPELGEWMISWLLEIRELYRLNNLRLSEEEGTSKWNDAENNVRDQIESMKEKSDIELSASSAHSETTKVLTSLQNHWDGLTVFLDAPHVPLDNNPAENSIRGPVVGRKNYYGSGAKWSAKLASSLFSIFATLKLHKINPYEWLYSYLNACAEAGGESPKDLSSFTPWINSTVISDDSASSNMASGFP
jgi:transposase